MGYHNFKVPQCIHLSMHDNKSMPISFNKGKYIKEFTKSKKLNAHHLKMHFLFVRMADDRLSSSDCMTTIPW